MQTGCTMRRHTIIISDAHKFHILHFLICLAMKQLFAESKWHANKLPWAGNVSSGGMHSITKCIIGLIDVIYVYVGAFVTIMSLIIRVNVR